MVIQLIFSKMKEYHRDLSSATGKEEGKLQFTI
jgi:hypothetical protein